MRPIKFRAYANDDRVDQELVYGTGITFVELVAESADRGCKRDGIETELEWYLFTEFGWVRVFKESIGQYIGLEDKNGREIYETDILEREGFWSYYVGFKDGCFVKVPCNPIQRVNWTSYPWRNGEEKNWEVQGNTFKNPEKLEDI